MITEHLLPLYITVNVFLSPLFYFMMWDFYAPKSRSYRRLAAALTLCSPVVVAALPFAAAAYCLFLLCRGIAKLIGIVAGEE
jgi:uncharacterized membrane protein